MSRVTQSERTSPGSASTGSLISEVSRAVRWKSVLLPVYAVLNLAFAVLILRRFGLFSGVYDVLLGLTSTVVQYSRVGIGTALLKFLPEVSETKDASALRRLLLDAVLVRMVLLLVVLVPLNLFVEPVARILDLGPSGRLYIGLASGLAVARALLEMMLRTLHAALLRGSKTDPQRPLPTDPLTTDSVRRRPTKLSHLIEDVTCEDGLRLLPRPTARSKALPDDQLVPEEGVLHTGLLMVARVLLPLSPSSLLHLSDRAVARGRSWSPSRHGGCPGRWNDDRRATRTRSLVDATRVVGRVRREAGDVAFDLVDQIEGRRRVVNMPAGQGVSDDHARSVDAQMKLLPAAYTASAMFHGRPFTFTHSREPGTVDDEMYACARGEAAKCKVEVLTTP